MEKEISELFKIELMEALINIFNEIDINEEAFDKMFSLLNNYDIKSIFFDKIVLCLLNALKSKSQDVRDKYMTKNLIILERLIIEQNITDKIIELIIKCSELLLEKRKTIKLFIDFHNNCLCHCNYLEIKKLIEKKLFYE